jgi:hypothetical protein
VYTTVRVRAVDWGFLGFLVALIPYIIQAYRNPGKFFGDLARFGLKATKFTILKTFGFFALLFGAAIYYALGMAMGVYYPQAIAVETPYTRIPFTIGVLIALILFAALGTYSVGAGVWAMVPKSRVASWVKRELFRRRRAHCGGVVQNYGL